MRWVLIGANVESASAQTVQQHVLGELGRTRMRADRRALESETGPARPDRRAEQPIKHLAEFKGVLQVDGYGGYRPLAEKGEAKLTFCWAHVCRPFYELAAAGPAPIATETLERIKALYAMKAEIKGVAANRRRAARPARSRPILE